MPEGLGRVNYDDEPRRARHSKRPFCRRFTPMNADQKQQSALRSQHSVRGMAGDSQERIDSSEIATLGPARMRETRADRISLDFRAALAIMFAIEVRDLLRKPAGIQGGSAGFFHLSFVYAGNLWPEFMIGDF
jgi:hypothetical protein